MNPLDIYQLGFKKKSIHASRGWEIQVVNCAGAADRWNSHVSLSEKKVFREPSSDPRDYFIYRPRYYDSWSRSSSGCSSFGRQLLSERYSALVLKKWFSGYDAVLTPKFIDPKNKNNHFPTPGQNASICLTSVK